MSTPDQDLPPDAQVSPVYRHDKGGGSQPTQVARARLAAGVVGALLAALGLRRRSLGGALLSATGGVLLFRAVQGEGEPFDRVMASTSGPGSARAEAAAGHPGASPDAMVVERSVTVRSEADDLLEYWRDPDELNRILGDSIEVRREGEERYRWTVTGPLGRTMSWEARIAEDRPGELLQWESATGASLPMEATVRLGPAPADRGTEARLRLRFDPPGGVVGKRLLPKLGVVPESLAGEALRRFKSLAETGEIQTLERNTSARGRGDLV